MAKQINPNKNEGFPNSAPLESNTQNQDNSEKSFVSYSLIFSNQVTIGAIDKLEQILKEFGISFEDHLEENENILQNLKVPGDITFATMSKFKKSLSNSFENFYYELKKN